MRSYVPDFQLTRAQSLEDALQLLASSPGQIKPLAGGTDLMVVMGAGKLPPGHYLDISPLQEMRAITVTDYQVEIGALCSYSDIRRHPVIAQEFPNMVRAAQETGAAAIQNRGTIGGNIANASPAADTPPAMLVYGAHIELVSVRGRRSLNYSNFHTGYKQTQMGPDELIASVHLPRRGFNWHYYRKVGTRRAQAISKVCVAAAARLHDGKVSDLSIALGAVAPTIVLCPRTAKYLATLTGPWDRDACRDILLGEIAPIDDIRSTKEYREQVAVNLMEEVWLSLRA